MNETWREARPARRADTFGQGIRDCVPTLLGYASIGFAFGIVGVSSGLSMLEVALLSVLVYAGSAQFIFCALLAAGSPASAIILTTFVVNLRHFLLSLTVAPYLTHYSLLQNVGFGSLLTDETFGVAASRIAEQGRLSDRWMNGLNVTAYLSWIASCTLGAVFGHWIAEPERFGLDFALVAMFAALLVLQLQSVEKSKWTHWLSVVLYMVIAMIVFSLFVPSYVAVLLSTVVVATIGAVTER
ncbi:AzlC family ABC transporter permease [Paenibacillus flagellatus]|uniref:Branched-chain amino acid ABC transporter permease n=1 Tax=Paenibacillus flagellatus TaxID=2211139 RepID=A0A2V5KT73_9BACL|nr:AzlC family ABC transporter permease [Paenibacillus flagellatus]PYI54877.1 branched-chain amino acid ABC transporter permease [Paenibacillus flagellatus]